MSFIFRPWTPPASLTRLKTASMPALMLTPQFATAPVRSMPAPITTSLSVTPSSAQAAPPPRRTRSPTSASSFFMASSPFTWVVSRGSSLAEVRATHAVVFQQLPAVAGERDRPRLEHVAVVGDGEGLVGVLLDQQHRGAAGVDLADDGEDLLDQHRGQPQGGLVQQHEGRLGHEASADRQHLLLAAAERAG